MSIQTYKPIATMITCRDEDEEGMVMLGAYRKLERANAALRKRLDKVQKSHFTMSKDNAALRADKKRLDWLDEHCEVVVLTNCDGSDLFIHNAFLNPDKAGKLRSVIDAYQKEAQP